MHPQHHFPVPHAAGESDVNLTFVTPAIGIKDFDNRLSVTFLPTDSSDKSLCLHL